MPRLDVCSRTIRSGSEKRRKGSSLSLRARNPQAQRAVRLTCSLSPLNVRPDPIFECFACFLFREFDDAAKRPPPFFDLDELARCACARDQVQADLRAVQADAGT